MVCNVIENCRCFAYKGDIKQFCGVRKGPNILPCSNDCCNGGGCPENGTTQPYRFIDRPKQPVKIKPKVVETFILSTIVVLFVLLYIDLKIGRVRKI